MTAGWKTFVLAGWGPAEPERPPLVRTATIPALGTFYVQAPDFSPEALRAGSCRCQLGAASIHCPMHRHLVITRRHVEDELLVLALV